MPRNNQSDDERHQLHIEKQYRFTFAFSLISCTLFIIHFTSTRAYTVYQCAALIMFILCIHFWIVFAIFIAAFERLYYTKIQRRRSAQSASLFLPHLVHIDESKPMTSISAFLGLRGTNIEQISCTIWYCFSSIGFSMLLVNMLDPANQGNSHYEHISGMISSLGIWILCTFPLESNTEYNMHDTTHLLGAGAAVIGSLLGYGIQQEFSFAWNSASGQFIVTVVVFAGLYLAVKSMPFRKKKHVHYQSLALIASEALLLICAQMAGVLGIYNLH